MKHTHFLFPPPEEQYQFELQCPIKKEFTTKKPLKATFCKITKNAFKAILPYSEAIAILQDLLLFFFFFHLTPAQALQSF